MYNSTIVSNPTAHITKNKSRLKKYHNNQVYLNHGDTFEIELYNPRQSDVLVKIKIQGKLISNNGIVVKPGQRIFLERFLDTNNKFVFNTYQIDLNTPDWSAIELNGDVEIMFYPELVYNSINYGLSFTSTPTTNITFGTTTTTLGLYSTTNTSGIINTTLNSNTLETGRVEKGEQSSQKFGTSYNQFDTSPIFIEKYNIKPYDEKVLEASDIVNYCSNCGKKQKKKHNYCPSCGTKL